MPGLGEVDVTDPVPSNSLRPSKRRTPDLEVALAALDNLATHLVESTDSSQSLEAGCLSCSFSKIEDEQL
jgi:hypothetical protein